MNKVLKTRRNRKGTVTIETAIFLPIFFFVFMAIFGVFGVIMARHQVRHAFFQATKSLSKDSLITERVDKRSDDGNLFLNNFGEIATLFIRWVIDGDNFSSSEKWYANSNSTDGKEIIKARFVGFLTGGDETKADTYLKNLRVKNGLSGVTFDYYVENGEMTITINYTVEYWVKLFGAEQIPMSHTLKTKMWRYDGGSGGPPSTT